MPGAVGTPGWAYIIVTMVGSIITAVFSSKLTACKVDELKQDFADQCERVNKHNNLVERISVAKHPIKIRVQADR